jgi:RNA polymerase sigma-70 factor (ECF subfamily)
MEDTELISRLGRGDRAAFGLLYERHAKAVYNFARILVQSVPDAEDVTQECFLVLVRQPRSFDPALSQLRTWLLAVARNQALQRRRNRGRDLFLDGIAEPGLAPVAVSDLMELERAQAVRAALAQLLDTQREALYLFDFEGLSLAETASVLAIEPNAVKARLFRAREQMKRLLLPLQPALSWKDSYE